MYLTRTILILTALLSLTISNRAQARLGFTLDQCIALYGPIVYQDGDTDDQLIVSGALMPQLRDRWAIDDLGPVDGFQFVAHNVITRYAFKANDCLIVVGIYRGQVITIDYFKDRKKETTPYFTKAEALLLLSKNSTQKWRQDSYALGLDPSKTLRMTVPHDDVFANLDVCIPGTTPLFCKIHIRNETLVVQAENEVKALEAEKSQDSATHSLQKINQL